MRHSVGALLSALTLSLAACGTGGTVAPSDVAALRVYNASPDSPLVNIFLRGGQITQGLAYASGRFHVFVQSGAGTLEVQGSTTADVLLDYPATLATGTYYTFAITGPVAALQPVFLTDDTTAAPAGSFKVRMVHLAPLGPAMDLYITGPTDDLTAAMPVVSGLAYTNASAYLTGPVGTQRLRITEGGTKTVLREVGTFDFTTGESVTLLLIGNAGSGGGGAPYSSQLVADHL